MLNLKKHNVEGLGYFQLLATCLAYFGKRRHDESDRNKKMIKLKWSMINIYHHNLVDDATLEKRYNCWRKHEIGDFMTSEHCMNDITIT